jgi:tRNA dimethylallyltransferase
MTNAIKSTKKSCFGNLSMSNKPPIIVIAGPTASGKTALAIALAQEINAEIISADSRQFYKGMDIGTAKPSATEQSLVPHYFIDICEITEHISAGEYERRALEMLLQIQERGKRVILTGGSGLYLQAVLLGLNTFPVIPQQIRDTIDNLYLDKGLAGLQSELFHLDPVCFAKIDKQNPARMRRALEVCLAADKPYSSFLTEGRVERPFTSVQLLLDPPRDLLYERINARVDAMIADGLEHEVERLQALRHSPAMQTIGYQEWFPFFEGEVSREEVIEKIKQHSRNYAKRQGTWFRKFGDWTRINGSLESALELI